MLWSIVAGIAMLVCVIVFVCRQTENRQPTGSDIAGKEAHALSGIDALELLETVHVPDRPPFAFTGYNGPRDAKQPADIKVTLSSADERGLVSYGFVTVGTDIWGTKFKLDSFEHKEATGADGKTKDVSEVSVINKETGEKAVLPLGKFAGYPVSYAIFHYKWVQPGGQPTPDFTTRLDHTFTLPPKRDTTYKVIAITDQEVVVEVPDGTRKTLTVPQ